MVELTYLSLKKTTFFVCIFDISHCVFTQISIRRARWWRIWFHIQRVPTRHTFDGPRYPKNKKYLRNMMMMSSSGFFRYFLILGYLGPSKVCWMGTCWMRNLIPHQTSSPDRNLSKNTMRYVEHTNKKSSFF